MVIAAFLAAMNNLCLRRSVDVGGSSQGYLVIQLTFSFFVMVLLNPVRTCDYAWNNTAVGLGLLGGLILGYFMWSLGKTMEKGPPGLSIAILSTTSVVPAIFLALVFGKSFGHTYGLYNGIGSALVVFGILWAGWTSESNANKSIWACFVTMMFLLHTLFLVFLQWWAMMLKTDLPISKLLPFHPDVNAVQWFMPSIFFCGAFLQWFIYFYQKRPMPRKLEVGYGVLGGIFNGLCSFFMIIAPQVSAPWENVILFPVFCVVILFVCNAWAQFLYKEKVNWFAISLCLVGLFVGSLF